jgi:hypothetical protein
MNMAAEPLTHTARANVFQREATWRLAPDALEREGRTPAAVPWWLRASRVVTQIMLPGALDPIEPGGPARFPYAEIRELRLCFDPTEADKTRYRCELRLVGGERAFIVSGHVLGVWEAGSRATTYGPLVRGLMVRAAAAANPQCRFQAGKRPLHYWFLCVLLTVLLVTAFAVLSLLGLDHLSEVSWAKLAVVVGGIPLLVLYARRNRPRSFDPQSIPRDVLPDA